MAPCYLGHSTVFSVTRIVRCARLHSSLLSHDVLAAIVTTFGANGVIHMPCSAVRALSDGGCYSHVVRATLGGTSLGLSTFRMCHFSFLFFMLVIYSFSVAATPPTVGRSLRHRFVHHHRPARLRRTSRSSSPHCTARHRRASASGGW